MGGSNVPVGFIELSRLDSGKLILISSVRMILIPLFFIILGIFMVSIFPTLAIFFIIPFSLLLLILFIMEYNRKKEVLYSIAVNLGHPWVEEEHDVNDAEVAFKTLEGWDILPHKGRIKDNLESNELLIEDESLEKIYLMPKINLMASLFSGKDKIKKEMIKWLNLALANRDAQNAVEDEIEKARSREDDEDLEIERFWPETNPGDLNVKPGIIFRKFSKDGK